MFFKCAATVCSHQSRQTFVRGQLSTVLRCKRVGFQRKQSNHSKAFSRQFLSSREAQTFRNIAGDRNGFSTSVAFHKDPKASPFSVDPFGSLLVAGESSKVSIDLLPPADYPSQDHAFITTEPENGMVGKNVNDIRCDDKSNIVLEGIHTSLLKAVVPITFDLGVNLKGDSFIEVEALENNLTNISIEQGHCILGNIKAGTVKVLTEGASVSCKSTLQADTVIETTGQGNISLQKPLGPSLYLETVDGDIQVDSLYSLLSHFVTKTGDIYVKNCHRDSRFEITKAGNLTIDSLDGSVIADIEEGNVEIHLSRHKEILINVRKGDILLKLPPGLASQLDIEASDVTLDHELPTSDLHTVTSNSTVKIKGCIPGETRGSPTLNTHQWKHSDPQDIVPEPLGSITVRTGHGKVAVQLQSWLQSLNLGKFSDAD